MTVFEQVKSELKMLDVVRFYGVSVTNGNMCLCPFHNEKTPSMKIYENNFHCFGCGEHGDAIDFTAKHYGISAIDAVKKLNYDFRLHIDRDKPLSSEQITEYQQRQSEHLTYDQWEKSAWKAITDYSRLFREWRQKYAPKTLEEEHHSLFVESLMNTDRVNYLFEKFLNADKTGRLKLREEVEQIEQRLERYRRDQISVVAGKEKCHKRSVFCYEFVAARPLKCIKGIFTALMVKFLTALSVMKSLQS